MIQAVDKSPSRAMAAVTTAVDPAPQTRMVHTKTPVTVRLSRRQGTAACPMISQRCSRLCSKGIPTRSTTQWAHWGPMFTRLAPARSQISSIIFASTTCGITPDLIDARSGEVGEISGAVATPKKQGPSWSAQGPCDGRLTARSYFARVSHLSPASSQKCMSQQLCFRGRAPADRCGRRASPGRNGSGRQADACRAVRREQEPAGSDLRRIRHRTGLDGLLNRQEVGAHGL